jgi:hypothetical protein
MVWPTPVRIISPWLMSVVHAPPGMVTLLDRANGLLLVAASGVQVPVMPFAVQDRKYRLPSLPMASTSRRYLSASGRSFISAPRSAKGELLRRGGDD